MDPKKISAWCAAVFAVGGILVYLATAIDTRAQEAAKETAFETVQQQMAPIQKSIDETNEKLEKIVEQGRRQEDRELLVICLDNKYQDLSSDDRYEKCEEESVARWEAWALEDEEDNPGD